MSDVSPIIYLSIACSVIGVVYYANAYIHKKSDSSNTNNNFIDIISNSITNTILKPISKIQTKPILWFVVDDYGVNSRRWTDFESRTSRDLNMGFLAITRSRCMLTQGGDFEIRECMGRDAVAKVIYANRGQVPANHLLIPRYLWQAWSRAALLYYTGGLYLDGLSLCLGPSFMSDVSQKSDAVFGTEHDEPRTSTLDGACSPFAGWASGPEHESWFNIFTEITELINSGAQSWSAANARNQVPGWYNKCLKHHMPTIRHTEWSRRWDGRPIEIEDIFGRSVNKLDRNWTPPDNAVYLPLDYEKIDRSVTYKWFLKLSAQEIISSDSKFLWAALGQKIGV